MIMQQQSSEELSNLLIQSLIAKDEKLMQKVLEQQDETVIRDVINRVPVNHVRKFVIELRNLLSTDLSVSNLQWLQQLLALKYSVISSMADGRSILIPLQSLLDDKSSPAYYNKMQGLKGKLTLLKQLKEARREDMAATVVRVQAENEQPAQMEIDSETDTDSEDDELNADQLQNGEDADENVALDTRDIDDGGEHDKDNNDDDDDDDDDDGDDDNDDEEDEDYGDDL